MLKIINLRFFKNLLLITTLFLAVLPTITSATVLYPSQNWSRILLVSILGSVILFFIFIISPPGALFIFAAVIQFIFPSRVIRIVAWIFQGLVFIFTFLLGIAGVLWAQSQYGEGKYILLISIIGAEIAALFLMGGTMLAQIIYRAPTKSGRS